MPIGSHDSFAPKAEMVLRMSQLLRQGKKTPARRDMHLGTTSFPETAQLPADEPWAEAYRAFDLGLGIDPSESSPQELGDITADGDEATKAETSSVSHATRPYQDLVKATEEAFDAAGKQRSPNSSILIRAVRQAYRQLLEDDDLLTETVRHRRDFRAWPQRAANVAILSMRIALELEADERRTLALGLCGLMHDVGMLTVPDEVLESRERLNASQLRALHRHPLESKRMIRYFGDSFSWIARIAAQTHERLDGTGYPYELTGDEIHEIARILGLADTFEAMAHPRPDRKARAMYFAVKEIIDQRNAQFDRQTIRALVHIVSIFSLGSLVRLNNGEVGRVLGISKRHPTRPKVEVLIDARGKRPAAARVLNLEAEPLIYIVDPAIEEEILNS